MEIPLTNEQSETVSLMWEKFMQPQSATFGQVLNIGCCASVLHLRVFTPEEAKKISEVLQSLKDARIKSDSKIRHATMKMNHNGQAGTRTNERVNR